MRIEAIRRTSTALCCLAFALAGADKSDPNNSTNPQPINQNVTEAKLNNCIGQSAKDVLHLLGLKDAKWQWIDEPPSILRGVKYSFDNKRNVTIYIAEGESLFRKFDKNGKWDYETFLGCKVGGIQYKSGDISLDVGPAVPIQWRTR